MQKFITAAFISVLAVTGWMATSNLREASPIEYNGTATISGIVTDDVIGQPIIGAQIALNNTDWFTTDSIGQFTIDKLPQGSYSLLVKAEGYTDQEMSITLTEGENKIVSISMSLATLISADTAITEFEQVYENENLKRKSVMANQESLTFGYATMDAPAISFRGDVYDEDVDGNYNTESYNAIQETGFKEAISNPLSTFSIDVDNASYSNIRRMINYGQQIPADAVRIEEMVNYFDYTYAQPTNNDPFAVQYELGTCPWNSETSLVMIGIQGKDIDYSKTAASNLVFLIDVSGSMQSENKLPLVKSSLTKLIDNLKPTDRVALVVYAGAAGEVLPSTPCSNSSKIKSALNQLEAGGSTAGGAGIQLAYEIATKNFIEGGNNRVILCTDGDFNVGSSSDGEMTKLIEEKRKTGVFITVCGFGMGNYKDSKMESIADNGNGAYYYIDDKKEAEKVFGTDLRGTLFTIAKDVKINFPSGAQATIN
ncbi:MAG TPA: von Willebrand factor type A domain-containing protein, partial [Chitinophagales bacterium]|nr:von Willebrand factor type A domain-containing protein [Chitinophagales bacterium]